MLSLDIGSREYEISGLKPMEVRMYDLAWNHNSDCLGFAGLCDLWFKEISPHITLAQIKRVWTRLFDYSYFRTDTYYQLEETGRKGFNDYVPFI